LAQFNFRQQKSKVRKQDFFSTFRDTSRTRAALKLHLQKPISLKTYELKSAKKSKRGFSIFWTSEEACLFLFAAPKITQLCFEIGGIHLGDGRD